MKKNFIKDAVQYLPAHIIPLVFVFISVPVFTRIFSPIEYGNYSLIMSMVMILNSLLDWLPQSVVRYYPIFDKNKSLNAFFGNIICLLFASILILIVIICSIAVFFRPFVSTQSYHLFYFGLGVFASWSIFNVFLQILRSQRRIGWYCFFSIWKSAISFALGLIIVLSLNFGINGILLGSILTIIIILPFMWKKAFAGTRIVYSKIDITLLKNMMLYSYPLIIASISAWILNLSDRYIIKFYHGSRDVGIYSASYDISRNSILLFINMFMLALGPLSMNIWENEGRDKSAHFINGVTSYYLLICIPAVTGLAALSHLIMFVLTGDKYIEGHRIFPIIALGIFFFGLQQIYNYGFLFHKVTRFISLGVMLSSCLNILLNFVFIPKYSYLAASITTMASYGFLLFLAVIFSRRYFTWTFPWKVFFKALLSSCVMMIFLINVPINTCSWKLFDLIASIGIGFTVYTITLLILRESNASDALLLIRLKIKQLS